MYKLFRALPRDLQWEILAEFVGTHAVRNGKLIQKIVYSTRNNLLHRYVGGNETFMPVINAARVRMVLPWLNRRPGTEQQYIRFRANKQVQFVEDPLTGDTAVCYHRVISYIDMWEVNFPAVRTVDPPLPPFVKHYYPSYPATDKKKKRLL